MWGKGQANQLCFDKLLSEVTVEDRGPAVCFFLALAVERTDPEYL